MNYGLSLTSLKARYLQLAASYRPKQRLPIKRNGIDRIEQSLKERIVR
jgi:hypothetical protein